MFDNQNDNNPIEQRKLAGKEQELAGFSEQVAFQANCEAEQQVPKWDRAAAFEQHFSSDNQQKTVWWNWQGIPALSMACSVITIALVMVFIKPNAELDQQAFIALVEEEVNKRLTEQINKKMAVQVDDAVGSLVDLKLREFAAEQQVILANYRADMSSKQQGNNLQLASYILKASRQERKEDIGDFISFINAQRQDEQLEQKIKFQQLEQEIGFQKLNYRLNEK
jgi:hypothetical protein